MNLIEQLGGYEKAKQKAENALANQVTRISYKTKLYINGEETNVVTGAYVRDIKKALLEYRRQHNIFEQGDPVVSRCADKETRIFTYQETIGKNILVKCKKGKGYCYPKKWFSHATDAEIKAGKRLEVNS